MRDEVKALWLDALRSGEYSQGAGYLTIEDEDGNRAHCCLGVLCDLAVKEGVIAERPQSDVSIRIIEYFPSSDARFGESLVLPEAVRQWADIQSCNPVLKAAGSDPTFHSLSELNDEMDYSFKDIADLVEDQL